MEIFLIFLVSFLGGMFGIFFVKYLTVHPLKMSWFLLAATISFVVAVFLWWRGLQGAQRWVGAGLGIVFIAASYLLTTRSVLSREDPRLVPSLRRERDDAGLGHTAVVYFTHGEPETYDPIGWINQFRELDEERIPFVPFFARPFFLHGLRNKYLMVGKSEHRSIHQKMIRSLEEAYRREGDNSTRFYLSFLDDNPRPDAAVIQALNEGASRIVICEVFLTDSNHTAEGKDLIKEVMEQYPRIPIRYTGPLHDSKTLQLMFLERANRLNGAGDKSKTGVLLVGHGQPDEWDREWPTETEQETAFRLGVLECFAANGYTKENLSLAWMEFKDPKPAVKVEEFVRNGVEKILYFPAAISADSLHSQYDIPELMHQARVPADFPMQNLGAWNDDPQVIRAIMEKIDAANKTF